MARGLQGHQGFEADADAYSTLISFVQRDELTCYISAIHLVESIRYEGADLEFIETYSTIVDALCANDSETLTLPGITVEGGERCLSHGEPEEGEPPTAVGRGRQGDRA